MWLVKLLNMDDEDFGPNRVTVCECGSRLDPDEICWCDKATVGQDYEHTRNES